ncbi:MAG TPA: acyl-CoA thioesterase [Ktedonobacterales bacterium]|nr:acyl-CoA thioesterase [Ktedonobacterales bacterium]
MSGALRAGAAGSYTLWVTVPVRYGDLDPQHHVNNVVYFTYLEQARLGYFDALRHLARAALAEPAEAQAPPASARTLDVAPGPSDDRLELPLVISEAACAYRRPITSLAALAVGVRAARIGRASLVLEYAICAAAGEPPYATGSTTVVCVDLASGRPRGLPGWTLAALRRLEPGLAVP